MKDFTKKNLLLIFMTIMVAFVYGQNSFLVQIGDREDISSMSNLRTSSSMRIKKVIQSPMNIILVEGDNLTEREVRKELSTYLDVKVIQKNRIIKNRSLPNDSLYSKQWQYKNDGVNSGNGLPGADINAEAAWDITTGGVTSSGQEIVVAVIDDGVAMNHPDLIDNLWKNKDEIAGNKIDDDGNGYIDDVNGWNVINKNDKMDDDANHGTPVAGIVGAKGNNKIGVTGVNWNVKIMPVYYGNATEANAIASYAYVYNQRKLYNQSQGKKGAFIVVTNASWGVDGGKAEDAPLWCAMYDSLGSIGVLNVAATANQNVNVETDGDLPTSCTSEYLVAVTNINKFNQKANAAFGKKSIDLAAYGDGVYTITKSNYGGFNGTSAAAPHVAGAVALMYSVKCEYIDKVMNASPEKAALVVKDLLLNNVAQNKIYEAITTTEGVLNLGKVVKSVLNQCGACVAVAGIMSSIVDKKNIKVEWLAASGQKQIRYKKNENNEQWTVSPFAIADSYLIKDLDYCNEYVFQIRQVCGSDTSSWSQHKYISTSGCCAAPSQTSFSIIDKNVAVGGSTGMQYLLYYTSSQGKLDSQFFTGKTALTNLIECSEYSFRLAEYCPVQEKYSNLSEAIKQSTYCGDCSRTYCVAGQYDNSSEWIEEVSINNIKNETGRTSKGYGEHIGYYIPTVKQNDSISLSIKPGFKGSTFREHYSVYVDWNSNGEFSIDENVYQTKDAINGVVNLKFGVPQSAKFGLTRMRVIMSYTANQAGCQGNGEYGETEDYCINVVNETSLPIDMELPNITTWPNPASGLINIKNEISIDRLSIIDYLGREVYKGPTNISAGESSINVSLGSGMYMLVFEHNGLQQMKKMIIE